MEVVAVSRSRPEYHQIGGMKLYTSIVHQPLTSPDDFIEISDLGVAGNQPAVHDGPVYVFFAENYDYWCDKLQVERSAWDWCHWGEK